MSITFDYDAWDPKREALLARPLSSPLGVTVIQEGITFGRVSTAQAKDNDAFIQDSVDGVIELLAGSLEWLRWFGLTDEQVLSKVRAYLRNAKDSPEHMRTVRDTKVGMFEVSDPENRRTGADKTKVVT